MRALEIDDLDERDRGVGIAFRRGLRKVDRLSRTGAVSLRQLLADPRVGEARVDEPRDVPSRINGSPAALVVLDGEDEAVGLPAGRSLAVDDAEEDLALEFVELGQVDAGRRG